VRGDKEKTAGKKERACRNRRKQGKKAAREKEKRDVGRRSEPIQKEFQNRKIPK
jgi:hypothetical protein